MQMKTMNITAVGLMESAQAINLPSTIKKAAEDSLRQPTLRKSLAKSQEIIS